MPTVMRKKAGSQEASACLRILLSLPVFSVFLIALQPAFSDQACSMHFLLDAVKHRAFRCGKVGCVWHADVTSAQVCHILGSYREAGAVHGQTDRVELELCFQRTCQVTGHKFVVDIRV